MFRESPVLILQTGSLRLSPEPPPREGGPATAGRNLLEVNYLDQPHRSLHSYTF